MILPFFDKTFSFSFCLLLLFFCHLTFQTWRLILISSWLQLQLPPLFFLAVKDLPSSPLETLILSTKNGGVGLAVNLFFSFLYVARVLKSLLFFCNILDRYLHSHFRLDNSWLLSLPYPFPNFSPVLWVWQVAGILRQKKRKDKTRKKGALLSFISPFYFSIPFHSLNLSIYLSTRNFHGRDKYVVWE